MNEVNQKLLDALKHSNDWIAKFCADNDVEGQENYLVNRARRQLDKNIELIKSIEPNYTK